jgi:hypothetical protein
VSFSFREIAAAKWEVRAGSIFIRAAAAYTENDDKVSIGTNLKLNAPAHPPSKSSVGECIKVQAARSPGLPPGLRRMLSFGADQLRRASRMLW